MSEVVDCECERSRCAAMAAARAMKMRCDDTHLPSANSKRYTSCLISITRYYQLFDW